MPDNAETVGIVAITTTEGITATAVILVTVAVALTAY
jgi:hypothetical protein